MGITIPLEINESNLEKIVDEYNDNESSFIHDFFEAILKRLADESKRISESVSTLNTLNPFGFVLPFQQQKRHSNTHNAER